LRRAKSPFLDPRLLLSTGCAILMTPVQAVRLATRYLRPNVHQTFVPQAWTLPILTPAATARATAEGVVHVVFVGPTIGEFQMMDALGEALVRRRPEVRVTYCLRDAASVAAVLERRPDASVCFRPVDFMPLAALWTRRFRPHAMVFVEGMRFPALAWTTHLAGAANLLVNGRCAARVKPHHRLRAPFFRWLFEPFAAFAVRSDQDGENAARWSRKAQTVVVLGDLKAALPFEPSRAEGREPLAPWLIPSEGSPLLAAGSVHEDEEAMVLDAFARLRQTDGAMPLARLLIAPRQTERAASCVAEAERRGFRTSTRTRPRSGADVFVLDTIGELAAAYAHCVAAYVGGSIRGAGHSVVEPLRFGIPIAYDPRRGHLDTLPRLCEERGVGTWVTSADELASHWRAVLSDPARRERIRVEAGVILAEASLPFERTVDLLAQVVGY